MAFSFLKRLFGNAEAEGGKMPPIAAEARPVESHCGCVDGGTLKPVEQLVDYVARALVDQPEQVRLESVPKGDLQVIQIHCFKRDVGKIIGKSGKTVAALRLLAASAAARHGFRATVDVMDD